MKSNPKCPHCGYIFKPTDIRQRYFRCPQCYTYVERSEFECENHEKKKD